MIMIERQILMENLITMLFLHGEDDIFDETGALNIQQMEEFIFASGSISEFDYYC